MPWKLDNDGYLTTLIDGSPAIRPCPGAMPSARSLRFLRTHTFILHGLPGSGFSSLPYKQNPCVQPDAYFRSSLATKRWVSKPCQSDGHPGGCHMQDPCEISIGDRTIMGHNVKFYGITPIIDPSVRNGDQGPLEAPYEMAQYRLEKTTSSAATS